MAAPFLRTPVALGRGAGLLKPTAFLFAVDTLANTIDYVFHIYLGRSLTPGDFGLFQTANSALLIVVTAFGVMQPVLARSVAEALSVGDGIAVANAVFRTYLRGSALLGLGLGAVVFAAADPIGSLLNIPADAVRYGAVVVLLVLVRPVVAGALQGAQRFVPFGFTRLAFALGRFTFAAAALSLGAGLTGAVASLPAGQLMAVAAGLAFIGPSAFRREGQKIPSGEVREGLRLAGWAFGAYAAFTALQSLDLLWVNRTFTPAESGAYAAAVLLRRILILFPGAAAVVMYPRIVAQVVRGEVPDRLLSWTLALVVGPMLALAAVFAAAGPAVVAVAFGPGYEAAGPLLSVMGVAMLAYGIASVWLNLFLATRPSAFVAFLGATALLQAAGLAVWHADLSQIAAVFAVSGWLLALGGGAVYVFRLRPGLSMRQAG